MNAQGTEARVCQDIAERQAKGIAKYGQTVADNPLTLPQWLRHAYEECLDQAVYLKRAMEEYERINALGAEDGIHALTNEISAMNRQPLD